MSWSRRGLLIAAPVAVAALGACGFAPVYGPDGAAGRLSGRVALPTPDTLDAFAFNAQIEDRLGRAGAAPDFRLSAEIDTTRQDLGRTSAGEITRVRLTGTVRYALTAQGAAEPLVAAETTAFTGYSATGSSVATLAGERDAQARLMVLLADQVVDALVLAVQ